MKKVLLTIQFKSLKSQLVFTELIYTVIRGKTQWDDM